VSRVLATVAISWILGLLLGHVASLPSALGLGALGMGVLFAYLGRRMRARLWSAPLILASFAAGLGAPSEATVTMPSGLARVEARVESVRVGRYASADVVLERGMLLEDETPLPEGARLRVRDLDAAPGSRVRVLARVGPARTFHNRSPHPAWLSMGRRDGEARALSEVAVLEEPSWSLDGARRTLRTQLDATLPPRAAGVARALLLGDGHAVDEGAKEAIRGAGLAHLLAVSGLHVALVVALVVWVSRRVARVRGWRDGDRWAALCGIPAALGFATLAGGAPSAWRAATMATIALTLVALRRRPSGVAIAGLAALVFAGLEPSDAVRPAFLLSICATAAIVTARLADDALRAAWQVSWRSTVATAPLVVWCFGELPPLGVLANVVLVPVGTIALVPLAFLHALAASVGLEGLTAPVFTFVVDGLVGAAELFDTGATLPPPSVLQGLLLCALALSLLAHRSGRRQVAAALVCVLAFVGAEIHLRHLEQPRGRIRVTFLDVGQGDGALVDLPDGRLMLVDAGGTYPDPGERVLLPLLRARRRSRIDLAVISHPHPDHYAGLRALLDEVPIAQAWVTGQARFETPHGPAARLSRALRRRGTRVLEPPRICGEHDVGGAILDVVSPCPRFDAGYGLNDNSITMRLRYGNRSVLFTGDVETDTESRLADGFATRLRSDVLKVPHHGSRTSSTDAFLDAVAPRLAVASMGRGSRYGHPHAEVVARYRERGIPFLKTAELGGVTLITDGETLTLESALGDVVHRFDGR